MTVDSRTPEISRQTIVITRSNRKPARTLGFENSETYQFDKSCMGRFLRDRRLSHA